MNRLEGFDRVPLDQRLTVGCSDCGETGWLPLVSLLDEVDKDAYPREPRCLRCGNALTLFIDQAESIADFIATISLN